MSKPQHTTPCGECPFRRDSLRGYLGDNEPKNFALSSMTEIFFRCHKRWSFQCPGRATMWANTCKLPRDSSLLVLPKDHDKVFSNIREFLQHHCITLE